MQFLAIDLGDKRTGLAVGDAVTGMATPLGVLEVAITERGGEALLDALAAAIREQFSPHARVELVIGLPLNMAEAKAAEEAEGPRARMVRAFGLRIAERTGRKVHFQDERLSSAAADWTMAQSGLTHKQKKARRDALAAAGILGDFLRGLGRAGNDDP